MDCLLCNAASEPKPKFVEADVNIYDVEGVDKITGTLDNMMQFHISSPAVQVLLSLC